jgi:8-hydroxy-5-deazaflavin:NADPH oxidoreductase
MPPTHAMAQSISNKLKIGVIGSGHIGGTIGGLWVKAGHSVLFSSRHPEELKPLTDSLGPLAKAGTVGDALDFGDVILVAVPYKAIPELAKDYGPKFAGKIVIDPANAVARRDGEDLLKETKEKGIGALVDITTPVTLPLGRLLRVLRNQRSRANPEHLSPGCAAS